MSLIVSPSTGKLIKVGSKEFEQLLSSPIWRSHFTSPLTAIPVGTVKPINVAPRIPIGNLPPMPLLSTAPVLTPISPMRRITGIQTAPTVPLQPLKPLNMGYITSPLVPMTKSVSSALSPMMSLPPIQLSNILSSPYRGLTMKGLPVVPTSPTRSLSHPVSSYQRTMSMSIKGLPMVPSSPSLVRTPLGSLSMNGLPPISTSPRTMISPYLGSPMTSLPPLRSVVSPPVVSSPVSPSLSMNGLPAVPSSPMELPVYDIPSLEKILTRTHQPHLKRELERMIAEKRENKGRGIKTRGWKASAPKKGRDRNQLMDECGSACFLKPDTKGFPICPKCQLGDGKCICAIDCRGVMAVKIRASQWKYPDIAALADKLLQAKCPTLASFVPK